jgi:hypothetical protein
MRGQELFGVKNSYWQSSAHATPPNTACSGLAGMQGSDGKVLNPPAANARPWAFALQKTILRETEMS